MYTSRNFLLEADIEVPESVTNQVLTRTFRITPYMARTFRATIYVAAATSTNEILAKLQTRISADLPWVDAKTVEITTTASPALFQITLLAEVTADQTHLPLAPDAQIVITTGADDTATITSVFVAIDE